MATSPLNSSNPHEFLLCGVCEEPYDDNSHRAKFLTCYHTFCSQCLTKLSNKDQVNQATIECPNCRSHTHVPENGIDGLQTNFYITGFQEFSENLQLPSAVANVQGCPGHNSQPINYFCVTCGLSICRECILVDHAAMNGHSVINISKEDATCLEDLNVSRESLAMNKRNLQLLESEITLLNVARDTTINKLETFIKLMHEKVEKRRSDLMQNITDKFNAQQNALLTEQKQIKKNIEILNKDISKAKIITTSGDLSKLKPVIESLKKTDEETRSNSSNVDFGKNYIDLDANKGLHELNKCLCALGQIYTKGFLPSMVAFKDIKAIASQKATLTVEVYNHQGDKLPVSSESLSVKVMDPVDREIHATLCKSGSDNTVTFTPQMSGLHEISVTFLGQKLLAEQTHISVSSNNLVLKFGQHGSGHGTFNYPWSIAIDTDNCLYVTDAANQVIQKFTEDGKFLSQFSLAVRHKKYTTCGIALDCDKGLIYCPEILLCNNVLHQGNNLLVFNREGEFQRAFPSSQHHEGTCPLFIAMDNAKHLFISDSHKSDLTKVDTEGKFVRRFGDLKKPGYIAVDEANNIIVSDEEDNCIYIFTTFGKLKHKFGASGTGTGELLRPRGVATDGENILVTEEGNNRIQVFRYDGTFVSMIESSEDPLKQPCGPAVTQDGHVYVCDRGNHCIKKYKYRDIQSQ